MSVKDGKRKPARGPLPKFMKPWLEKKEVKGDNP